jgi:SCY1-like protein 1
MHPTIDAVRGTSPAAPASTLHRQPIASPPPTSVHDSQEGPTVGNDDFEAWGSMEEDTFFGAPAETQHTSSLNATNISSAKASFDDGGEPDFAGWLSAQAQAKSKTHLPKGLARPLTTSATHPGASSRSTPTNNINNTAGTKKNVAKPKSTPIAAKRALDTKPKDQDWTNDDGWGDGWE